MRIGDTFAYYIDSEREHACAHGFTAGEMHVYGRLVRDADTTILDIPEYARERMAVIPEHMKECGELVRYYKTVVDAFELADRMCAGLDFAPEEPIVH